MIPLSITPNINVAPWTDLIKQGADGSLPIIRRICGIPNGMEGGLPAVAIAIQQEDGEWVMAQTSLRLLRNAVAMIEGSLIAQGLIDLAAYERD